MVVFLLFPGVAYTGNHQTFLELVAAGPRDRSRQRNRPGRSRHHPPCPPRAVGIQGPTSGRYRLRLPARREPRLLLGPLASLSTRRTLRVRSDCWQRVAQEKAEHDRDGGDDDSDEPAAHVLPPHDRADCGADSENAEPAEEAGDADLRFLTAARSWRFGLTLG
jgi:hypothetical protein